MAGWHESKCSRILGGKQAVTDADIRAWCTACGTDGRTLDELLTIAHQAESAYQEWRKLLRGGLRHAQDAMMPLWERTAQFRIYEPGFIPGPFQTLEYAKVLLARMAAFYRLPDDSDAAAQSRVARRRLLHTGSHRFAFVVEEAVLHYPVGGVEVMTGQLDQVVELMGLPSVSLGIIPEGTERLMWPTEQFWILDTERVMVETVSAQLIIKAAGELDLYVRTFEELSRMAVYGEAARTLIAAARRSLR
jgi:hypothetical protein